MFASCLSKCVYSGCVRIVRLDTALSHFDVTFSRCHSNTMPPVSLQELHKRLTDMEAASSSVRRQSVLSMMDLAGAGGGMLMHSSEASSNMDAALKRGEREKQMELLVSRILEVLRDVMLRALLLTSLTLFVLIDRSCKRQSGKRTRRSGSSYTSSGR